jgi:hypothetical protein
MQLGFVGILLYSNLAGQWCDEPPYHWLYARAEELGIPILLHPAKPMSTEQVKDYELTSTLGNMFENTIAIARIIASGLLDRHPNPKNRLPAPWRDTPVYQRPNGSSIERAQTWPPKPPTQAERVPAVYLS